MGYGLAGGEKRLGPGCCVAGGLVMARAAKRGAGVARVGGVIIGESGGSGRGSSKGDS